MHRRVDERLTTAACGAREWERCPQDARARADGRASSCRRSSLPVKTSPPLQTTKPVMTHASIGSRLGAVTPSGTSSWSSRPCGGAGRAARRGRGRARAVSRRRDGSSSKRLFCVEVRGAVRAAPSVTPSARAPEQRRRRRPRRASPAAAEEAPAAEGEGEPRSPPRRSAEGRWLAGGGGASGNRSASKQSAARSNPSRADAASSAATRGTKMEHRWAAAAAGWPPERVTGWEGSVSVCASSVVAEKSRITCGAGSREGSRWARQPRGGKEQGWRPTRPRPWSHRARSA